MESVARVYPGKFPNTYSPQPTSVGNIVHLSAGPVDGLHVFVGVDEDGYVHTRVVGHDPYKSNVRARGNAYLHNGVVYYIDYSTGDFCSRPAQKSGDKIILGSPTVLESSAAPSGGFCCNGRYIAVDNGGIRLQDGSRFYPLKNRDYFFAACYGEHATFTQDDGAVWRNVNGARSRIFYGDLSLLAVDTMLEINGRIVVLGRYVRTGNLDDGTVDYIISPIVNGVLALPPFSLFLAADDDEGPAAISVFGDNIAIGTFNKVAVGVLPFWLGGGKPKAEYSDVILGVKASFASGAGNVEMEFPDMILDIEPYDLVVADVISDRLNGIFTQEMIVSSVSAKVSGAHKTTAVIGNTKASWMLQNTRVPNYIEVSAGNYTVDAEPWKQEKLFSAASPRPYGALTKTLVDFWAAKPFSEDGFQGYEITPGLLSPIHQNNIGIEAEVDLIPSGEQITFSVYGWSKSASGYQNHEITLYIRDGDGGLHLIGSGRWPKTYDGQASGDNPIVMQFQVGNVKKIKGIAIGMLAPSGSDATAYPASVIVDGVRNASKISPVTWVNDNDSALALKKPNTESAMLAVSPYAHQDITVAASFCSDGGSEPNTDGDLIFGIVFGAKDLSDMNAIVMSRKNNTISLVKVRESARDVVHSIQDANNTAAMLQNGVGIVMKYTGGKVQLYQTDKDLTQIPGTLVFEYEWSSADGDIMPTTERHVGVYGLIQTHEAQALAWDAKRGEIVCLASDGFPQSGKIEFLDGTVVQFGGFSDSGYALGAYQVRNTKTWQSDSSANGYSGPAAEISLLDWNAAESNYKKPVRTSTGYGWNVEHVDTAPYYIREDGAHINTPDRMRFYSSDVTGSEAVGLDTKAFVGGSVITGVEFGDAFVSPPEPVYIHTTEKLCVTKFMAFEPGAMSLGDAITMLAGIAGVSADQDAAITISEQTEVKLP